MDNFKKNKNKKETKRVVYGKLQREEKSDEQEEQNPEVETTNADKTKTTTDSTTQEKEENKRDKKIDSDNSVIQKEIDNEKTKLGKNATGKESYLLHPSLTAKSTVVSEDEANRSYFHIVLPEGLISSEEFKIMNEAEKKTITEVNKQRVVDTVLKGEYYPFEVRKEIPQLITYDGRITDKYDKEHSLMVSNNITDMEQVKETEALFNDNTLVVWLKMVDEFNGVKLADVNATENKVIDVYRFTGTHSDLQPLTNTLTNKIILLTKIVYAAQNKLYEIPEKVILGGIPNHDPIVNAFSQMTLWKGDHPHPYFMAVYHKAKWVREELQTKFAQRGGRIILAEDRVVSLGTKKMTSRITAVLDQYAAQLAIDQFERWQARQMTTEALQAYSTAGCAFNDVAIVSGTDGQVTLNYDPPPFEWALYMTYIIKNVYARTLILINDIKKIEDSGSFRTYDLNDILNPSNTVTIGQPSDFMTNVRSALSVNTKGTIETYLATECYAANLEITLMPINMPSEPAVSFYLLAWLVASITFPKTCQRMAHLWGYRGHIILKRLAVDDHRAFVRACGFVRRNGRNVDNSGTQMSEEEAIAGNVYSILDPTIVRGAGVNHQYFQLIVEMIELIRPRENRVVLQRKRDARLPYAAADYVAHRSWPLLPQEDALGDRTTDTTDRIATAVRLVERFNAYVEGQRAQSTVTKQAGVTINTFYTEVKLIADKSATLYNATLAPLQEAIMNGPLFVIDQFEPNDGWIPPQSICIQPTATGDTNQGIPVSRVHVQEFDMFAPLRFLLTTEGIYSRNLKYADQGDPDMTKVGIKVRREINSIDGPVEFKKAMKLLSMAVQYGIIEEMIYYCTATNDPNNPILEPARMLSSVMKMTSWAPLTTELLKIADSTFPLWFTDPWNQQLGALDGRQIDAVLNLIDRVTKFPMRQPPRDTIFGVRQARISDPTRRSIAMISRLLFSPDSQLNAIHVGVYIGRQVVTELTPQILDAEDGWEVVEEQNYTFEHVISKGGYATAIRVHRNGVNTDYILGPNDDMPKLLLVMEDLSKVRFHTEKVAASIKWGKLKLKVTKARVLANVVYAPDSTTDYSMPLTVQEIMNLIDTDVFSIIPITFIDTTYATQFTTNVETQATYYQWLSIFEPSKRSIVAAALVNAPIKPANSFLTDIQHLGYGLVSNTDELLNPITNVPKTLENVVNMNNRYPAISKYLAAIAAQTEVRILSTKPVWFG